MKKSADAPVSRGRRRHRLRCGREDSDSRFGTRMLLSRVALCGNVNVLLLRMRAREEGSAEV